MSERVQIIPIYRPESVGKFVDSNLIDPTPVIINGEQHMTAPLAFNDVIPMFTESPVPNNNYIDLLGISMTDKMLADRSISLTDTIDPDVCLTNLYINLYGSILKFNVSSIPLSTFTNTPQDNYRILQLNFFTNTITIDKNTKCIDGSALNQSVLDAIGNFTISYNIGIMGTVNIETGQCRVDGSELAINSITIATEPDMVYYLINRPYNDVVKKIIKGRMFGYDLLAYRK